MPPDARQDPQPLPPTPGNSPALHVLVIEDKLDQRAITQATLEAAGMRVSTASTLTDAQQWLGENSVDAVLIDLGLPDAFGLQSAHKLAAMQLNTPFLVLTATDDPDLGLAAVQIGAEDVLVKGSDEHRLVRTLRFAVARYLRRAALLEQTHYFERIIDEIPDALLVLDKHGRVVLANRAAGRLYDRDPALLRGERLSVEIAPGQQVELRVKRGDGKEVRAVAISHWLDADASPLRLVSIREATGQ